MQTDVMVRPVGVVLAEVAGLLDGAEVDVSLLSDAECLAVVGLARQVAGRLQVLAASVAAAADAAGVSERVVGVPLTSWLAATQRLTRREAGRLVLQGRDLAELDTVRVAALEGRVGPEQTAVMTRVLRALPPDFGSEQRRQAEESLVEYAQEFDSAGLSQLTHRLVELLDPVGAEEREGRRLERELRVARAARHLSFVADGQGSVLVRGSLPVAAAEPLIKVVDAYAGQLRREQARSCDRLDPLAERVTPGMRRADALCALVAAHQQSSLAPSAGGDRPRVVVTLDFHQLRRQCIEAGLLEAGTRISAGDLRRLACDAEIVPTVLGGASDVLDVGRSQRLVTPGLRTALAVRDRGCVFPGCDAPAGSCHAHHLVPWWMNGRTSLENLVLVCPHHHGLVEPSRDGPAEHRWRVRLGADGIPEVVPPSYVDPTGRPRRHQRWTLLHPARE